MAIASRKVKNRRDSNGILTGKPGTVYDVNIKYTDADGKYKAYVKKGFVTQKEAQQHEAEMKQKLSNPSYVPAAANQGKMTVKEYMETWVEQHGKANLRPSTFDSYKGYIKNHINPNIGHVQLRHLTPAMIDNMFQKMFDKGLSQSSVRYAQRVLSVAFEAARKYRYIETNPARDIITKFGKQGKTPDPYTIEQMQKFMAYIAGGWWETPVMLAGLYGMRMSEILGLRLKNIDMDKKVFGVVEQLPYKLPPGTTLIQGDFPPVKGTASDGSGSRILPITDVALPYFERQIALIERQKEMTLQAGMAYFNNDLFLCKPDGSPYRRDRISNDFSQMLRRSDMPHIRFHDLRHTAATNMFELTGDFYTVGSILGHSLKGIGMSLGVSTNLEAVTAQYVDVRLDRRKLVLEAYHDALNKRTGSPDKDKTPPPRER